MKKTAGIFRFAMAVAMGLCFLPVSATAVPILQLDIEGATYDAGSQTVVATSEDFTLSVLLTPQNGATQAEIDSLLDDTYYLSIAVNPALEYPTAGTLGSFFLNGEEVVVTSDMVYGVPPIENYLAFDAGDLAKHDEIFPTYFIEVPFQFSELVTTSTYNVQDDPGSLDPGGVGSFYVPFEIASSNIDGAHSIHFDAYNTVIHEGKTASDTDVGIFAPFSHDAESSRVPEPGALPLLGMGLLAVTFFVRRID